MAKENSSWGFDRIQDALSNVGYHISDTTVRNILKVMGLSLLQAVNELDLGGPS